MAKKLPIKFEPALWIRRAVALDVYGWLDPRGVDPQGNLARKIQGDLATCLEAHYQSSTIESANRRSNLQQLKRILLPLINIASDQLLKNCVAAIADIENTNVKYMVHIPDGNGLSSTLNEFDLKELPFLHFPLEALENMMTLRAFTFIEQIKSLNFLNATAQVEMCKVAIGLDEYFNDQVLSPSRRDLIRLQKQLALSSHQLSADLQKFMLHSKEYFESSYGGYFPLALALSPSASSADLINVSRAFDNLAGEIRPPLKWALGGSSQSRVIVQQAWDECLACSAGFKVIAAWVRVLSGVNRPERCAICFRRRGARLYCDKHNTKSGISREIRVGLKLAHLYSVRINSLMARSSVQAALHPHALKSVRTIDSFLKGLGDLKLPENLLRNCFVLASQIRQHRSLFGPDLYDQVKALFMDTVQNVAITLSSQPHKRSLEFLAEDILSLRGLLRLWMSDYLPPTWQQFNVKALGNDRFHPLAKGEVVDPLTCGIDLIQHRAWNGVMAEYDAARTLLKRHIWDLRTIDKLSLRDISKRVDLCPETVRTLLREETLARNSPTPTGDGSP